MKRIIEDEVLEEGRGREIWTSGGVGFSGVSTILPM